MNMAMKYKLLLGLLVSVCSTPNWADTAIPDIKANQSDEPITINATDNLSVTIALNSNDQNENADWWLVADTPTGLFSYQDAIGWQVGIVPMKQTMLSMVSQQEILNIIGLPTGTYTIYFGFDSNMNAELDLNQAIYDEVNIKVLSAVTYPIVDTAQGTCYNNSELIDCPAAGADFYGQDTQYTGNAPSYTDNGNGTINDNITGLVWTQDLSSASMPWSDASGYCESLEVGDITDWRLPNVKELWSIRDFSTGWPWVDTDYFYLVGDGSQGAQQHSWSSNYYLVNTEEAVKDVAFIVNDWTGHIKALDGNRFVRCVSGDEYGINDFVDNSNGTITDNATGLMWAQNDSGEAMDWEAALAYAEASTYAGYDDWHLPNVKELQSIADYSGAFPAIDSTLFNLTGIINEAGNADYPFYWTNTSNPYIDPKDEDGYWYAWYVAAGYAVDMDGNDTHGAGAVRFDTKSEDGADGPDGERYYNYVRLVRGGDVTKTPDGDPTAYRMDRVVVFEDGDTGNVGGGAGGPQGGPPDFVTAAEQLSVTEEVLIAALGDPNRETDYEAAAAELGVTVEALQAALMVNSEPTGAPQGGADSPQRPDMAAAAAQLGVTEEALIAALGDPAQGAPDFAAAAEALGVTEADLMAALGGTPEGGMPSEQPAAPNAP